MFNWKTMDNKNAYDVKTFGDELNQIGKANSRDIQKTGGISTDWFTDTNPPIEKVEMPKEENVKKERKEATEFESGFEDIFDRYATYKGASTAFDDFNSQSKPDTNQQSGFEFNFEQPQPKE